MGGVMEDVVGGEAGAVVAGDDVEHDESVASRAEGCLLSGGESTVRGAEEGAVDQLGGQADVGHVVRRGQTEAADVVIGVVADGVSGGEDGAVGFGVTADVVADAEEGGGDGELVQHVEQAGGGDGVGAVVEGDINTGLFRRQSPD